MTEAAVDQVMFDAAKRNRLRKAYEHATSMPHGRLEDTFEFEGNTYLIAYAGYLLDYLDMVLGP